MSSFRRAFAKGGLCTDTTFDIKRCSKSFIELGALRQGLKLSGVDVQAPLM